MKQIQRLADLSGRQAVDLGDLTHGCTRGKGILIGDHRSLFRSVSYKDPFENLGTFVPWKVDVDIRWVMPAWVQEALEQQIVPNRIDMSDAQTIGDDRGGRGSSSTGTRRFPDNLIDHQKVVGIAFFSNHR
jgi:hypothetical protein